MLEIWDFKLWDLIRSPGKQVMSELWESFTHNWWSEVQKWSCLWAGYWKYTRHTGVFFLLHYNVQTIINLQSSLIYHTSFLIKMSNYYGSSNKTSLVTKSQEKDDTQKFLDVYLQPDNLTVLHITLSFFITYKAAIFIRETHPFLIENLKHPRRKMW